MKKSKKRNSSPGRNRKKDSTLKEIRQTLIKNGIWWIKEDNETITEFLEWIK